MTNFGPKARLAAAGAVALALAACDDRGGRVDAPEPAPLADLSAMEALPYAEPARVAYREPAEAYAWAERAYGLQRAVYDTPPDYGFGYGDIEPLAWETGDDWAMYAEPWDDGYRYYYYEPGAAYPYFVRDDDYGYGYGAGGVLVAVFDAGGRYLPVDGVYRMAPAAGRYYARGHDLRSAARRAPRIQVTDRIWAQRAPQVVRTADPWLRAARDDRQWRAWRGRDQDRELRRFEPEAARRAERTKQWRERDDRREAAAAIRVNQDPRRHGAEIRQQQAERQRLQVERQGAGDAPRREQAQRQQAQRAQAERERLTERHQQAQQQRQQADQQREHAQQQWRQAEQQQRQQAQNQQAQRQQAAQQQRQLAQQQRRQDQQRAQQAQQQRQQADQQRHQQQRQRQAQARSAEQQGQPAAGRERGGKDPGKDSGRGRDRKD